MVVALSANSATASAAPIHGVNVVYSFPHTVWNYDQWMRVTRDTPGQYYASAFYDSNWRVLGYYGLQPDGNLPDGRTGVRQARFSMWDANGFQAASGTSCRYFSHEGSGVECARPYNYATNVMYAFRVTAAGDDTHGRWWKVWVRNRDANGSWTYIANIRTSHKAYIRHAIQFTESWRQSSCWGIAASEVHMVVPFGNGEAVHGGYQSHSYPNNPCARGSFQLVWQYGTGILKMGG
jgi:hypothetical protein